MRFQERSPACIAQQIRNDAKLPEDVGNFRAEVDGTIGHSPPTQLSASKSDEEFRERDDYPAISTHGTGLDPAKSRTVLGGGFASRVRVLTHSVRKAG